MSSRVAALESDLILDALIAEWLQRQPGHDVSDEPRDEGGRWTSGGEGGDGGTSDDASMRLVGTGQNKERTDKWIADLKTEIEALPQDQVGGERDGQLNGMKTALELYQSAPTKLKGAGERSLHTVHDGNGKLLAAVYTQYLPEGNYSSIESMGGLEHAALVKALGHMVTHEEKDNHAARIEMTVFDDDKTRLDALKELGFRSGAASGNGVQVMIKGDETTQAEKDRAARMSAEHTGAILGAGQATAKLLGYDPKLVRVSKEDYTFTLTGTVRHAAGLAHLATGVITLYPERIYSAEAAVGVAAHEVAHQKYQTVLNFVQKEREALWEADRQAAQQHQDPITNPDGTIKEPYRNQFPLVARFEKHEGPDAVQKRIDKDGVTDYSKDYWKDAAPPNQNLVTVRSASHETIAEMARLEAERQPSTAASVWKSYYKDVMKTY
ncbi:MAG TPA: hypothetical protein VKE42_04410, partial [Candidatus Cybelea sp.]|nr:hypothetical protein [Candidatus Cybelea sp.]